MLIMLAMQAGTAICQSVHERIYMHTDRNYYQTGELMWFRIYSADASSQLPSTLSSLAYVELIDSVNKPALQTKVQLDSGAGNGSLAIPQTLPTGIYLLRCYTNWMKNFGVAGFFTKEIAIVNAGNGATGYVFTGGNGDKQGELPVEITTGKDQYGKRDKVTLTLSLAGPGYADVSISVYRLDSLIKPDPSNIHSWLTSPFPLTDPKAFSFPPEYQGHFINGRIINSNSRMPSKAVTGYLTVMDDGNSFYNAIADDRGRLRFFVNKLNPADSIIVQTHSYYNPHDRVEIESPFFTEYVKRSASHFAATDKYPSTVLEQSINAQATTLYYEDELNTYDAKKSDTTPFYTRSNARYLLDNYTRFSRLEDVFREYVRPVGVSQRRGSFHLSVYNASNNFATDAEPLVIVDGVPVFNMNSLFAYDPLKVKTIDVVTTKYYKSGVMFPGIIDLATYRRKTDGQLIDANASVLAYEVVQKKRLFHSPAYGSAEGDHMPDFRTTLYWNPSVRIEKDHPVQVEFYTGDLSGDFYISVQGLSGNKSGSSSTTISIR